MELILIPEARSDIAEAYLWYEEQSHGLGLDVLHCFEASLLSIQRNPLIYRIVHKNYHRALTRRFPYAIFYEYTEQKIIVYAVFHCSQNPEMWLKRLS